MERLNIFKSVGCCWVEQCAERQSKTIFIKLRKLKMFKKIKEYYLAAANSINEFQEDIDSQLSNDWYLYGNPFSGEAYNFNQAMVKYEED